ncbi:nicotinamide riboside transporter PnuC [Candidatus Sororendozoicomonas aggregata]|uniref:nicotinamide riboside transporter PnuC n=1 Tax=Candidatus Sororendozoicomonas aggregata TaxID=3073239 RepID=UPI002ECFCBE5
MAIWTQILEQLSQTSVVEFMAVITGILSVWFNKQEKILVYPFGIISVTLYIFIDYRCKLYADSGINTYCLLMSLFGWYHWKNTKTGVDQIPISKSSKQQKMISLFTLLGAFVLLWIILRRFTDSDVPAWDALTTAFAITGMYLMALKKVEHWYCWIGCNLSSIPLYTYKGLPLTGIQFIVFACIAISGLVSWKKKLLDLESR